MTAAEIRRFKRAFEFAVANGFFDAFCDEHNDHNRQHNHGAEVDPNTPMTISIMPAMWGNRLLPWHRAFILEGEAMLRGTLRMLNKLKGENPREADLLFIPYWNATQGKRLPQWVNDFQPKGGTALAVEGLPKGHAGYGKEVGTRYNIEFGRWPGTFPGIELPTDDNIRDMMGRTEFADFVRGFDTEMRIVTEHLPKAEAALKVLEGKLANDPALAIVKQVYGAGRLPETREGVVAFNTAIYEVGWRAAHTMGTDAVVRGLLNDMYRAFYWSPHARMHLWAGGVNPQNVDVRGTVTYFNELAVDPAFWMLHTSLDRAWYMWEEAHPGKLPPLDGEDRLFNPLTTSEGAWYGGGRIYTLDDLMAHEKLPYTYST